jgi:hypothetical protein
MIHEGELQAHVDQAAQDKETKRIRSAGRYENTVERAEVVDGFVEA